KQNGSGWGVYGQQFKANGTPQGVEFQVNSTTDGDQNYATVATNANRNMVVAWSGNGAGDSNGVFAQRHLTGFINISSLESSDTFPDSGDERGPGDSQEEAVASPPTDVWTAKHQARQQAILDGVGSGWTADAAPEDQTGLEQWSQACDAYFSKHCWQD